jgi:hypothetical protein
VIDTEDMSGRKRGSNSEGQRAVEVDAIRPPTPELRRISRMVRCARDFSPHRCRSPRLHHQLFACCCCRLASAFDGQTLSGWHPIGKGEWKVEDGAIVGRHSAGEAEYGHLVTDAVYTDFIARFKFKSIKGNSGFYFRIEKAGFSGVTGFQAEIDPRNDVGGLYETNGRSWVVQPKPEQVKSWLRADEWNEMSVSAHGTKIIVKVNGQTTAEIDDPKGRREGHLALQVHGGQEGLVYFKDLEIRTGAGE